jgi:ketosteroid isomerase-like protein
MEKSDCTRCVEAFLHAFNDADFAQAFALLSTEAEWWLWDGAAGGQPTSVPLPVMRQQLEAMAQAMPEPVTWTPLSLTSEGTHVFAEIQGQGRAPSGMDYRNSYAVLFTIEDRRIIRVEEMFEDAPARALLAELTGA